MQLSRFLLAATAVIGSANALVQFTNSVFNNVTAGEPFTLTWSNATGPVTIKLKNGPPPYGLKDVETVVSGATGGSYTWNVPATLAADTYSFEISDGGPKPNYSVQFQLIGGVTTTASSTKTLSSNGTSTATQTSTTATDESSTTTRSSTRTTGTATSTGSESSGTSSPTSAPAGGMAAGLTSNLAFVFLAVGALMTLN